MIFNIKINPELSKLELGELKLVPTQHARDQAISRRIELPQSILSTSGRVVEVEANGKQIYKIIVRINRGNWDDCFILAYTFSNVWTILTCYANRITDTHKTLSLKEGKYAHRKY